MLTATPDAECLESELVVVRDCWIFRDRLLVRARSCSAMAVIICQATAQLRSIRWRRRVVRPRHQSRAGGGIRPRGRRQGLRPAGHASFAFEFGVPGSVVPIAAVLLPLLELATAVALIPRAPLAGAGSRRWCSASWAGLSTTCTRAAPDCHCFGQLHSAPAGREALVRNGVLAVLAAVVIWQGPGPSIPAWVSARTPAELVAVGAVAVALVMSGVALRLWLERRRLREDLAGARAHIAALPRAAGRRHRARLCPP